jgi:hypothetical protein
MNFATGNRDDCKNESVFLGEILYTEKKKIIRKINIIVKPIASSLRSESKTIIIFYRRCM